MTKITHNNIQNMTEDEINEIFSIGNFLSIFSLDYAVSGFEAMEQSIGKALSK